MKDKLEVGQSVWVTGGFRARPIEEAKIVSIGKKYFHTKTVHSGIEIKFSIEFAKSVEDSNYPFYVWLKEQDYYDKVEREKLYDEIRKSFSYTYIRFTLEQLRQVAKILEIENKKKQ
jgi:hypothetical protein